MDMERDPDLRRPPGGPMTRRMWLAGVAAVLALAAAVAIRFTDAHDPVSTLRGNYDGHASGLIWDLVFSALWLAAGLFAWRRRPDNRVGPLMVLLGFAYLAPWVLIGFGRLGFGVAALVDELVYAIGAHLFLAFPTGRLTTRLERTVVAVMYIDATVIQAGALFARDFRTANCQLCPPNPFMIRSETELANALVTTTRAVRDRGGVRDRADPGPALVAGEPAGAKDRLPGPVVERARRGGVRSRLLPVPVRLRLLADHELAHLLGRARPAVVPGRRVPDASAAIGRR